MNMDVRHKREAVPYAIRGAIKPPILTYGLSVRPFDMTDTISTLK